MNVITTVKKCMFNHGLNVLRLSVTIEGIYFIFFETYVTDRNVDRLSKKKMLWNGITVDEANREFESNKWNPEVTGEKRMTWDDDQQSA